MTGHGPLPVASASLGGWHHSSNVPRRQSSACIKTAQASSMSRSSSGVPASTMRPSTSSIQNRAPAVLELEPPGLAFDLQHREDGGEPDVGELPSQRELADLAHAATDQVLDAEAEQLVGRLDRFAQCDANPGDPTDGLCLERGHPARDRAPCVQPAPGVGGERDADLRSGGPRSVGTREQPGARHVVKQHFASIGRHAELDGMSDHVTGRLAAHGPYVTIRRTSRDE